MGNHKCFRCKKKIKGKLRYVATKLYCDMCFYHGKVENRRNWNG